MRYLFLLFIPCIVACCEERATNEISGSQYLSNTFVINERDELNIDQNEGTYPEYDFPSLAVLISDTLTVAITDKGFCLNHDLDSLTQLADLYSVQLVDVNNDIVIINWPPMFGAIQIERLAEGKYEFTGSANFPVNGDWDIEFVKHDMLRYILEIHADYYVVYRDKDIELSLPFSKERIDVLKKEIMVSQQCLSEDWEVAINCFPKIKRYEYHLFAAILAGESKYEADYLNLRNTVLMANAGEFSEYIQGNYYLLRFYGITDDNTYDYSMLRMLYGIGEGVVCY